jgi:hypothetical protein
MEALEIIKTAVTEQRGVVTAEQSKKLANAFPAEYFTVKPRIASKTINPNLKKERTNFVTKKNQTRNPVAAAAVVGDIANAGSKAWQMISENKAVVMVDRPKYANAVPQGIFWEQLEGWSKRPVSTQTSLVFENKFGFNVVELSYVIKFHYGGNIQGKGQFLANVTAYATNVETSWGFKVSMGAEIGVPLNIGPNTDPIAALPVVIQYSVSSVLKSMNSGVGYSVQGTGTVVKEKY